MKFGGTSVARAEHWRAIRGLVDRCRAERRRSLVVVSALAGVTDLLLDLDRADAGAAVDTAPLRRRHADLADDLGVPADPWLEEGMESLERALAAPRGAERTAAVLAHGEWFSSQLGAAWLRGGPYTVRWVDAREALAALPEPDPGAPRAWLSARCDAHADEALQHRWGRAAEVLVTQGYVVRAPAGGTALLGRSGSDTSAALLGARLAAERVEIWTDVPGLFTADPRLEPNARLITELGWEEALEMAASGARVIHGRSIRAAAAAGLPLWIRDLADPDGPGTHILADPNATDARARAVTSQPGMLVLLLRNLDTRQQVGFLAGVFRVISERGLSVDQVATSETTTTLAIDAEANHLDAAGRAALVDDLSSLCQVTPFPDCVCVSVVGRDARLAIPDLAATGAFLAGHRLLMLSHSAADRSVSFLVDAAAAPELARTLHAALVVGKEPSHG